ncbi:hypothetical protein PT169_02725 [Erysipelothrix rhusiopathiae]|uniref:hypothetical protein n=1 Tax=Erysipelothrix rhusiopathiae TaxID=1648 RepID=UPI000F431740|nr:hypothetical protein [Erysipelothrix rhusiopathiae]AYV33852.1 hypothetical protein EEY85_00455 [Erysipelothrix rhusiopathiae]MDE8314043.1 hypothetical protein [Erysipelothrix rhusiopathiae]MDE8328674.1 hypothetical protein [Erysipelothrix rhusiopathiae]MDE8332566.1 hypothetical protein [Erysipelothrix rhusiopathiae]
MTQERQTELKKSNKRNQRLIKIAVVLMLMVIGLLVYQKSQTQDQEVKDDTLVRNVSIPVEKFGDTLNENAEEFYQNLVKAETIISFRLNPLDMCVGGNQSVQARVYVVNIEEENPETKNKEYKPEYLISGATEIMYDSNEVKGYKRWIDRSSTIEGIHELVKTNQLECYIP